ncbi:division/cell wall cluster transcriptional repressor MraZ [Mycoplasma anserisalpingitidis]|uniref:Transcriptional regulator MraZ n=1 Tax=Mycoplasma anserisalpingitidis TaxID=519450 RepID=A0A5B8K9P5_9MOLU|nr:division/cell wall cluster transcriptional repressor MraZ [Mycoplasma anserisalpingitidis]QDY88164.1 division/cell wall cluster transcriptional repressor MraZ [Mycoplasma anserisalpingitidis]
MFGTVERKIDDKNRIVLPTNFRDLLGSDFYLTIGFDGNGELRSKENFIEYTRTIEKQSMFNKNARALRRSILGRAINITLDSAGRFLLPKNILENLAIQKDVVFVGVGSIVEIWSKERYDEFESTYDDDTISQIAQELSNLES